MANITEAFARESVNCDQEKYIGRGNFEPWWPCNETRDCRRQRSKKALQMSSIQKRSSAGRG